MDISGVTGKIVSALNEYMERSFFLVSPAALTPVLERAKISYMGWPLYPKGSHRDPMDRRVPGPFWTFWRRYIALLLPRIEL
jgi:hypothetical protein